MDETLYLYEVKAVGASNWTVHVVATDQGQALAAALKCNPINMAEDMVLMRPLRHLLMPHAWKPENRP